MKMNRYSHSIRLTRLSDAFLPASLLAASTCGQGKTALRLYLSALTIHLLSLGASCGIRAAFAGQTTVRAVRGSVKCAILLHSLGLIIILFLLYINFFIGSFFPVPLLVAGFCLNIEHMFYEYLYAIGDSYSAAMCHGLTALFTIAGLALDAGGDSHIWTLMASSLSAAVSLVISVASGDGVSGRVNARVMQCAPRAMLHSALYPTVFTIAAAVLHIKTLSIPFFTGLIVYALCRTPFRRTHMESRSMNRFLFALSILSVLVMTVSICCHENTAPQAVFATCGAVILASLCSFIVFGRF